jgi:uncharacterized membrane protein YhaH (DUF805 family)
VSVYPSAEGPTPRPSRLAPLDQPQYDATIAQAASRFWRKFATFSGRASRSEYWWWVLVSFGISVVLQLIGSLVLGGGLFRAASRPLLDLKAFLLPLIPALVWALVALVPSIALAIRRLHDTDRSGWWYLLSLPSLIGLPFEFVGLASMNPQRMASGDFSGLAVVPLVVGAIFTLIGAVGSIVMLVFLVLGPNPRGARFDRTARLGRAM